MPSVPWTEWKTWDNWKRLCGAEISRDNGVAAGGFHTYVHLYPFEPLPDPPMVFNTNWCLTDYTKDDGWPGGGSGIAPTAPQSEAR